MTAAKDLPGLRAERLGWSTPERRVLENLSFHARPGEITGLLGVNGSGKSTLLKLLAGLISPKLGRVYLQDTDIASLSGRERAKSMTFLEQSGPGAFAIPVKDVVLLGRLVYASRWAGFSAEDYRIAGLAMEQVGISRLAEREWHQLSGGEQQRVHLARALAQQTPWLLLDEPANHLDIAHQQQFMALLRRLGISVVVSLHDLNLAACYCDRLMLLKQGYMHAFGSPEEVLTPEIIDQVYGVEARLATVGDYAAPLIYYPAQ
ncbi:Hemin import ATP-binding protein HmuV [Serratia quinivorans]|uniref:ABC transporter ATP-binding protein n=1 Tax=Serratia quinivorans TaxID=137545 RepID=UPI0021795F4B|nr:ABC transporter ATP-binding protein [Serratia quinivorans]CAI1516861.1 Hemin import ATP-binding protein HmuV [Serratia quinivorans]